MSLSCIYNNHKQVHIGNLVIKKKKIHHFKNNYDEKNFNCERKPSMNEQYFGSIIIRK